MVDLSVGIEDADLKTVGRHNDREEHEAEMHVHPSTAVFLSLCVIALRQISVNSAAARITVSRISISKIVNYYRAGRHHWYAGCMHYLDAVCTVVSMPHISGTCSLQMWGSRSSCYSLIPQASSLQLFHSGGKKKRSSSWLRSGGKNRSSILFHRCKQNGALFIQPLWKSRSGEAWGRKLQLLWIQGTGRPL